MSKDSIIENLFRLHKRLVRIAYRAGASLEDLESVKREKDRLNGEYKSLRQASGGGST